jgi:hypothetical protein
MARIFSYGAELGDAAKEGLTIAGGVTVQSVTKRSGSYAFKHDVIPATNADITFFYASANQTNKIFFRAYINFSNFQGAQRDFVYSRDSSSAFGLVLKISSTGQLGLFNNSTQIGSWSSALNTGQWYRVEWMVDCTPANGSRSLELKIDGTSIASAIGNQTLPSNYKVDIGADGGGSGNWTFYTDDIAANDSTGSFQNSYPGQGNIIFLRPNSAGDINTFGTQTGGTAGAANNFTRVDEVTPDDATTFNGSNTTNQEDLYRCDSSGLNINDVINVVNIGWRYRRSASGTGPTVKVEVMKISGGTKAQSSGIIPNSTTWKTNANASPWFYPITQYLDPDNSVAWNQNTLDTMQIGVLNTQTTTPRCDVSTVWALVDYTPSSVTSALTGTIIGSTEKDIVSGGKTIILTLTGDTWIAAGAGSFDLQRANIIAGLTSAQSETFGWNNIVKTLQSVTGVVRTSNTVVTITLDAQATYNISVLETITATIPSTALTGGVANIVTPPFTITQTMSSEYRSLLGVGI